MGNTRSSADAWSGTTASMRSARATFGANNTSAFYDNIKGSAGAVGVLPEFDPAKIGIRESRISDVNPLPTPISIWLDNTGSMSSVLTSAIAGLGIVMKEVYDKLPVSDPHILCGMVNDINAGEQKPLQATQFESDLIVFDQLKKLFIQDGGGGNGSESYSLPLYFAHFKTDCDAFADGRKGFIFVIGDDGPPPPLTKAQIQTVFGNDEPCDKDLSYADLLALCQENWEVFHINVLSGTTGRSADAGGRWTKLLGERFINLKDVDKLAEVISATLQILGGNHVSDVAAGYDAGTALVIRESLGGLTTGTKDGGSAGGVARL